MYAIIRTGGKQARVHEGDVIDVEKMRVEGDVTFTPLLVVDDDGNAISDRDQLAKATVTAEVLGERRGEKVDVLRYKNKSGSRRRQGHRQTYTTIKVTKIDAPGAKKAPAKKAPAKEAPAKEAPAKDAPAKEAAAKEAEGKAATEETAAPDAPAEEVPAKKAPAKEAPAKDARAKDAPAKDSPAKDASSAQADEEAADEGASAKPRRAKKAEETGGQLDRLESYTVKNETDAKVTEETPEGT